jgi:hypothetical protein
MNDRFKLGFVMMGLAALALVAGCADSVDTDSSEDLAMESGFLAAEADLFYDFGPVNIEGGLVDHTFSLANEGEEDLMIYSLVTSCMCTEAEVILSDGTTSPAFGMHGSEAWSASVAPGDVFEVRVIYDPMAHGPNAVGAINRSVIMTTSSQENGRLAVIDPETGYAFTQINIKGEVMYAEDFEALADEVAE